MTRKATSQSPLLAAVIVVICLSSMSTFAAQARRAGAEKPSTAVNFEPAVTYGSGGYIAQGVAIADLNGDGIPDIVVENWWNPSDLHGVVGVLLGNGDSTFQPAVTYETAGAPNYSVALADVNGDGKIDIIVASCAPNSGTCGSSDGVVSVLIGNGNGTFQSAVSYDSGAPYAVGVAVADVNGDGKPDLIVTNYGGESNGSGTVAVLLGNGNGTFQPAVLYDSGAQDANGLTVADVNGDGIPDILVANRCVSCSSGVLSVLFGKGNGTFQPAVTYPTGGTEAGWVRVADLNGDGIPDVVVANENLFLPNGTVAVFLGLGGGGLAPAVTYSSGGYAAVELSIDDMNGDGKLDIVVADCGPVNGCGTGQIGVLLGNGDGTLQPVTTYSSGAYNATALAVADLNGDGKLDIVAGNQCEVNNCAIGSVGVMLNITVPARTTTTVTSSSNPSLVNQSVMVTAMVTSKRGAIPNGELVTFYDDSAEIGTGTTAAGVATFTTSTLTAGAHHIKAAYAGDVTFNESSGSVNQVVDKYATATTLTSSLNPAVYGQPITYTATVTSTGSKTPTGNVRFTNVGLVPLIAGVATITKSKVLSGKHTITANYLGNDDFDASKSPVLEEVVNPASTTLMLTSSANPSTSGETVTFTATVTSSSGVNPYGWVTFTAGTTELGAVQLSGTTASISTATLPVGSTTITASYPARQNFTGSTSSLTQVVKE